MRFFLVTLLALVAVAPLSAQRYLMKGNRVVNHADITIRDGKLVRTLTAGATESFAFSDVLRLDFPEPAEIEQARALLVAGNGTEAFDKILPVYRQFAPFSKVPGSWWPDAAMIRARALLAQEKFDEADRAAKEIISASIDAERTASAQLLIAELQMRAKRPDLADAMLDSILSKQSDSEIEARALILRGDIAYQRKNFERALEYYLQVPTFYGTQEALLPAAILGSARAYKGYGDAARSERAYLDLIVNFASTSEATTAKAESQL